MIDPATGWFEILQFNDKKAATVANLLEQVWLCRYTRMYYHGIEFLDRAFKNYWVEN